MKKKLLILLLFFCLSVGFSKSYFIKNADVNIVVQSDGLVSVTEQLTFSFDGCYRVIYREIPLFSNDEIINFVGESTESFFETKPGEPDYFIYEFNFNELQCNKETLRRNYGNLHYCSIIVCSY